MGLVAFICVFFAFYKFFIILRHIIIKYSLHMSLLLFTWLTGFSHLYIGLCTLLHLHNPQLYLLESIIVTHSTSP